jgi:hypothetical protein
MYPIESAVEGQEMQCYASSASQISWLFLMLPRTPVTMVIQTWRVAPGTPPAMLLDRILRAVAWNPPRATSTPHGKTTSLIDCIAWRTTLI